MGDQSNKQLQAVKKIAKKVIKAVLRPIIIGALIIAIIAAFICSILYVITLDTGTPKEGSWGNVPYASSQYSSDITIDEDGIASTNMSAQEVWDKLIENKSNITEYLKSPKTLKKLLNAGLVTNFLDTRQNPDAEIDWDKLNEDTESKEVQGIIKLRRALDDGNKITMVYVDPDTFQSYIDEYNATGSEAAKQQALRHFTIEKGYAASNFGTGASITAGTSVDIPSGLGSVHTYMGWQCITSTSSAQYKLRQQAGMNFDEEGFGRINGRYVIACTSTYGQVGDYVDFYQEDGSVIQCIIGDIKNQSDAGCNEWGHSNGECIIEFVVDKNSWYSTEKGGSASSMHINPGHQGCHPEWNQNITKVVNGGSYFDNPSFGAETIVGNGITVGGSSNNTTGITGSTGITGTTGSTTSSGGNATINGEPMKWPTDSTNITSYFGVRKDPTNTSVSENHGAIDISVPTGSNVYATEAGTVITARYGSATAGNYVEIDHGNGYISRYLHNSSLLVKVGDKVTKGQVIALSGSTGKSTGPHCHFEIRYNGVRVDPLTFKYDNGMGNGMGGFGSDPDSVSTTNKYYAKVATWTEIHDKVETNDPEVEAYDKYTYNMTTTRINYEDFVSGYTMPFEYLWSFLVIGQEEEFVSELADLVYGSEIEITVHDSLSINTNINTDTYTRVQKVVTKDVNVAIAYQDLITIGAFSFVTGGVATRIGGPFTGEIPNSYKTVHTVVTKSNTVQIALTRANVWIVDYSQEFVYQTPEPDIDEKDYPQVDEPYPDIPYAINGIDALGFAEVFRASMQTLYQTLHTTATATTISLRSEYYKRVINRNIHVYNRTDKYIYVSSPAKVKEKVEKDDTDNNFVKIYTKKEHAKNASNIHSAPDWLFLLLGQNAPTANMVDVTKYLLYKAMNSDYGVLSYDFNVYKPENFKTLVKQYTNISGVPGKVYNFLLSKGIPAAGAAAVLGNIQAESSFDSSAVNSIGCSGLCQWKDDRLTGLKSWAASKHVQWTDVDTQLEYMWSELEAKYPSVKNKIMGTTSESDIEYATWYWGRYYEIFFIGNDFEKTKGKTAQRYQYALQWYGQYNSAN